MRAVDLATTAGLTALALVTPHKLSRPQLAAYVTANCAIAGLMIADAVRQDVIEDPTAEGLVESLPESVKTWLETRPVPPLLATGAAGAAVTAALMPLGLRMDRGLHQWLERRGVSNPRLVIAGLTTASGLLAAAVPGTPAPDRSPAPAPT